MLILRVSVTNLYFLVLLGGGHQSYDFFSEKLNVTVSLAPQDTQYVTSVAGVSIFNSSGNSET